MVPCSGSHSLGLGIYKGGRHLERGLHFRRTARPVAFVSGEGLLRANLKNNCDPWNPEIRGHAIHFEREGH